jgi:3-dehydroquinate dehydratase-2
MTKPIYIINGPNLNLLGTREPEIYGSETLQDIENICTLTANAAGYEVKFMQSNHEGQIIDWLHEARTDAIAIILNAGALTHTSVGLYDALKAIDIIKVEVHLSNPHSREEFRHKSFISPVSNGVIAGFGIDSYILAINGIVKKLT